MSVPVRSMMSLSAAPPLSVRAPRVFIFICRVIFTTRPASACFNELGAIEAATAEGDGGIHFSDASLPDNDNS